MIHLLGHALRAGLEMFWQTLWALVLGLVLSGVVQAYVPSRAMVRSLGTHRPAAVARAAGWGMASSSCSYAGAAMARSLFSRGADIVTSMVFMVASTNLVIELAFVLAALMGWQFVAGEYVGGTIMIGLLVLVGAWFLRGRVVEAARARAEGREHPEPTRRRWTAAARYTMADLRMLRREVLVGFVVAGFLVAAVPDRVWNALFLHGHGVWTTLENVVVGPFVAIISFVCSIGNVPMAAALWNGGISFGGVLSFLFADLIAFPMLLVYRRAYGTRLMIRMLAVFWAVMSLAGLLTEGLFHLTGWVPTTRAVHLAASPSWWGPTTWLNLAALVLLAAVWRAARTGARQRRSVRELLMHRGGGHERLVQRFADLGERFGVTEVTDRPVRL